MDKNEYREEVLRQLQLQNEQNNELIKQTKLILEGLFTLTLFIFLFGVCIFCAILYQNFTIGGIEDWFITWFSDTDSVLSPFYDINNALDRISNSLDSLYEQIAYIRAYMR